MQRARAHCVRRDGASSFGVLVVQLCVVFSASMFAAFAGAQCFPLPLMSARWNRRLLLQR